MLHRIIVTLSFLLFLVPLAVEAQTAADDSLHKALGIKEQAPQSPDTTHFGVVVEGQEEPWYVPFDMRGLLQFQDLPHVGHIINGDTILVKTEAAAQETKLKVGDVIALPVSSSGPKAPVDSVLVEHDGRRRKIAVASVADFQRIFPGLKVVQTSIASDSTLIEVGGVQKMVGNDQLAEFQRLGFPFTVVSDTTVEDSSAAGPELSAVSIDSLSLTADSTTVAAVSDSGAVADDPAAVSEAELRQAEVDSILVDIAGVKGSILERVKASAGKFSQIYEIAGNISLKSARRTGDSTAVLEYSAEAGTAYEVAGLISRIARDDSTSLELLYSAGRSYFIAGDFKRAAQAFEDGLRVEPQHEEIRSKLYETYLELANQTEQRDANLEALGYTERAIRLIEANGLAYYLQGLIFEKINNHRMALSAYALAHEKSAISGELFSQTAAKLESKIREQNQ